jgi:hypothetical protein
MEEAGGNAVSRYVFVFSGCALALLSRAILLQLSAAEFFPKISRPKSRTQNFKSAKQMVLQ